MARSAIHPSAGTNQTKCSLVVAAAKLWPKPEFEPPTINNRVHPSAGTNQINVLELFLASATKANSVWVTVGNFADWFDHSLALAN